MRLTQPASHPAILGVSVIGSTSAPRVVDRPAAFVPCPQALLAGWSQEQIQNLQALYAAAYEQAQIAVSLSNSQQG